MNPVEERITKIRLINKIKRDPACGARMGIKVDDKFYEKDKKK